MLFRSTNTGAVMTFNTMASSTATYPYNVTEAMRIDAGGNVGIGTSSPAVRLHVTKSGADGELRVSSAGTYSSIMQMLPSGTGDSKIVFDNNLIYVGSAGNNERMRISTSGYFTGTVNLLGSGLYQASQYYRLNSGYAGSNSSSAQSMLGVGVTLVANTVYEFEIVVGLVKTSGTTAHTIGASFGGTATINNIGYSAIADINATSTPGASNLVVWYVGSASNTTITASASTAAVTTQILLKGTVSIANGGTFIPQYTLSAAPGGAYTTQIGSYMKISPLGASGANTSIGSWA